MKGDPPAAYPDPVPGVTCSRCGHPNAGDARFCSECGAALALTDAAQSRRTVTVLFCDVVGSTALGERLDPEALRRRDDGRYRGAMQRVVELHGGTVEKFIGDAVMAVFGRAELHEDDALRAVRAALEMRSALVELDRDLETEYGVELGIRIGVHTGEVITAEGAVDRG